MQRAIDPTPATSELVFRPVLPAERGRLLAWLDRGLRDGRRGRLAAEYGAALEEPGAVHSVVASCDGRFVAHALARLVDVRAGGVRAKLGLIGLVYTEPAFRRRGLAARCLRGCEAWLAAQGSEVAVLWSDRHAWYEGLGYHLAGVERMFSLDGRVCRRAAGALPFDGDVTAPSEPDWPALESLHERHESRAERRAGFLASLASGPDCRIAVARRGETPVAYAALGRGDDFAGVVHEWAGAPEGVLACVARLREGNSPIVREGHDPIALMVGPGDDPLAAALSAAGASERRGGFGLVRLIEPDSLWARLTAHEPGLSETRLRSGPTGFRLTGANGTRDLDGGAAVRLLLDPGGVEVARDALSAAQVRSLSAVLPWPLFIWGFDSV